MGALAKIPPGVGPKYPQVLVLVGATGDLSQRKLLPGLFHLCSAGFIPACRIIGVSLDNIDVEAFRAIARGALDRFSPRKPSEADWANFSAILDYVPMAAGAEALKAAVAKAEHELASESRRVHYLSVPPAAALSAVRLLAEADLVARSRIIMEKPFGTDLASAKSLNAKLHEVFDEDQIFRIDHFLGKDTVQSIMAFRFANGLFEPAWNRDRIDHVQITIAETIGVERRGKFYEETGALRDMVPNHALTLVSMVAMEPPPGFDAGAVRSARADVFTAMPVVPPARAVRGQYSSGRVLGEEVKAYREEPDVGANSNIETFAAIEFEINNPRWAGVPFFVRTGKHMSQRMTEIAIRFKQAPFTAFQGTPVAALRPNWLVLRITPDKGISMQFDVKRPGPEVELATVKMDFRYNDWFADEPNVGYETLLHDVMVGDQTLFMRADMVENAWRIVQPVLDSWAAEKSEVPLYPSGTDGPPAADALLADTGDRAWRCIGGAGDEKS